MLGSGEGLISGEGLETSRGSDFRGVETSSGFWSTFLRINFMARTICVNDGRLLESLLQQVRAEPNY